MDRVPLTVRGAEQLRRELQELKSVKRPQVIEAIATARAHGDLRENAEYHAAREQQSFIEGRIRDIEGKLSNAEIVDVSRLNAGGRVTFGATVILADENTGEEFTYTIVGEDEADIKQRMVSISSPIARAMIGKEEGDVITVDAPAGDREYEIVEVSYGDGEQ
ncbi:MAG: transcription elongation factor GreA [Gammaproteobacteria bacterium]|nr:transcription elongation factor GreA [Gammaproteobacteria bacterium]